MSMTLVIRHLPQKDQPDQFRVERPGDAKTATATELTEPDQITVEGRPNSNLLQDLRWYLENFLDYPLHPNTDIAERVQSSLKNWGEACFSSLFSGRGRDWYQDARRSPGGLADLTIKIAGDDPRVLSWPWEALRDPEGTTLAHSCRIDRQLNELHDPLPLPENLPADGINILLIIARPYGDQDVGYHALARPLVELAQQEGFPVQVDVLRPPTFDQLRQKLHDNPGRYHIVHFDGHGGYGDAGHGGTPHTFKGPVGQLVFETHVGQDENITAEQLTQLLTEHRIPLMVLNACQSATIDERAEDPFASVAAALLKSGIRSVVAMGYSLYVSGAQQFVPAFYKRLFATGTVAEATRAGRQAMLASPKRDCILGEYELQDWLVPILYEQDPISLAFEQPSCSAAEAKPSAAISLPKEALEMGDYGFIGRDCSIMALERALRLQPQAGLLIHGMAGVGKTTLIQGFLRWMRDTNGLAYPPFWFRFDEIRSAEFVVNTLLSAFCDTSALAAPLERKIEILLQVLSEHPFLMVWDNFESAAGIPGTEVAPQLPDADRQVLKGLLSGLRNKKTKILITSRSPEQWLDMQTCFRLPLSGFSGEDCWAYCNAVVRDLGLAIKRNDSVYGEIMRMLDGHPLAMRAVLMRLAERSAAAIKKELEQSFAGALGDASTSRIEAALNVLATAFPSKFAPALQLLGQHTRYVDADYLKAMLADDPAQTDVSTLERVLGALESAGQLHHLGRTIYSMHPALSSFLRQRYPAASAPLERFVHVMARLADSLAPRELHEQRVPFSLHGGNFYAALALAKKSNSSQDTAALTQALATYSLNMGDFSTAKRLYMEFAEHAKQQEQQEIETAAYHQLGRIAEEQRDFDTAEQWYKKSLAIEEKQGNEHGAATSYHQLGLLALAQDQHHDAGRLLVVAAKKFLAVQNLHAMQQTVSNYINLLKQVGEECRNELLGCWNDSGLPEIPPWDKLEKMLQQAP